MPLCRLCLQNIEDKGISNPVQILTLLQKFLPHMNRTLINTPVICDICHDNVITADKLLKTRNETDTRIKNELKRLNVSQINLIGFHKNMYDSGNGVCRICLTIINSPTVFLCGNNTNMLQHDLILNMLNYCNLDVDLNVSNKPVMCLKCWNMLQIVYAFKKDYQEVERKIRVYCQEFRIRNSRYLSTEILEKVRNFFSEQYCEIIATNIKQENDFDENIYSRIKKEEILENIVHVKKENVDIVKKEKFTGILTPPKRIRFTKEDNMKLMRVYFEITKNEQDFLHGSWRNLLYSRWTVLYPGKIVPAARLLKQIHNVRYRKLLSKLQLEELKIEVSKKIKVEPQLEQPVENYSDSDDSFVEEVAHSSFTPHIKSEPLSESEVEFNFIEPKLEVESDCDSLPQLERMDIPPLQFKIENIYSLDVKREAFEDYLRQDEEQSRANVQAEEIITNRRVSLRDRTKDKDLFKCPDCSFDTTSQIIVERHMKMHQRSNKKIYHCTTCLYRISDKWLFNRHMKKHKEEEDEIPVLLPDALIPQ